MIPERRRFSRLYLFLGAELTYNQKDFKNLTHTVLLINLSSDGIRFLTTEFLEEGIELELIIDINDITSSLFAQGKVVWQKKISKSFHDTSAKLTFISDADRDKLLKYAQSLYSKNPTTQI